MSVHGGLEIEICGIGDTSTSFILFRETKEVMGSFGGSIDGDGIRVCGDLVVGRGAQVGSGGCRKHAVGGRRGCDAERRVGGEFLGGVEFNLHREDVSRGLEKEARVSCRDTEEREGAGGETPIPNSVRGGGRRLVLRE